MAKLTLNNITSGFESSTGLNTNNDLIEAAIENTLSRDGTSPNTMNADLDLNGYSLLNVANIATTGDGSFTGVNIHAATNKTTPVDADELPISDSAASWTLKKLTWANLKATLKTYFDGVYQAVGSYAALAGSILQTFSVSQLEVGHAIDTTITRASAGQIAVEGVNVLMNGGVLGTPSSGTLTNCIGAIAQQVRYDTAAVSTGTTVIPCDNTAPQITEGDQYMFVNITPKSATNKLVIEAIGNASHGAGGHMSMALFKDSGANCLCAVTNSLHTGGVLTQLKLNLEITAGSVSPMTFRIRMGSSSVGTTTFNGITAGQIFGGYINSMISVTEYVA